MQRNEITSLNKLKAGDCFYKYGDKNKTVWVVVNPEYNMHNKVIHVEYERIKYNKAGHDVERIIKHDYNPESLQVIFLHHKEPAV